MALYSVISGYTWLLIRCLVSNWFLLSLIVVRFFIHALFHQWVEELWVSSLLEKRASLVAQMVKCVPTIRETQVQSLGWEDLLEKEMATHSSILAWKIPWMEEPGRLQSMGSQRVGHDRATSISFFLSFLEVLHPGLKFSSFTFLLIFRSLILFVNL